METNSNEGGATVDHTVNMDSSDKLMNTDDDFFDDSAQVSDFDNAENDEGYEQRFQGGNRGGFRYVNLHSFLWSSLVWLVSLSHFNAFFFYFVFI